MKRSFDLIGALVGLIMCSPLMVLLATLIKLDDRGPVLFHQERVGRGGEPFRIHKFRTMTIETAGPAITIGGDSRVTRVGHYLRKWKLDELPQLFDVLRGVMSLVGPRPELPQYVALWTPEQTSKVLSVRPGITDPASIQLRNESDILAASADAERMYVEELMPRKVSIYLDYVAQRSFMEDLRIIKDTLKAVARG